MLWKKKATELEVRYTYLDLTFHHITWHMVIDVLEEHCCLLIIGHLKMETVYSTEILYYISTNPQNNPHHGIWNSSNNFK
jgi:hypothetical protein